MTKCAVALAVLVLAVPAANAADSFYAAYISRPDGTVPCYARTYDEKHLAANPKQKVIHFFVTQSNAEDLAPPKTFDLAFGFLLRDSSDSYTSEAGCAAKGDGAVCAVEGDGGHFRLTPRPDGLLVTIEGRLELEGMESFSPDLAESDDREFRLYESPDNECFYEGMGFLDEDDPQADPNAPALARPAPADG